MDESQPSAAAGAAPAPDDVAPALPAAVPVVDGLYPIRRLSAEVLLDWQDRPARARQVGAALGNA